VDSSKYKLLVIMCYGINGRGVSITSRVVEYASSVSADFAFKVLNAEIGMKNSSVTQVVKLY